MESNSPLGFAVLHLSFQLIVWGYTTGLWWRGAGVNHLLFQRRTFGWINTPAGCVLTLVAVFLLFAALLMHFSFLASCFWLNVMSFDIWRTFRYVTFLPDPRWLFTVGWEGVYIIVYCLCIRDGDWEGSGWEEEESGDRYPEALPTCHF